MYSQHDLYLTDHAQNDKQHNIVCWQREASLPPPFCDTCKRGDYLYLKIWFIKGVDNVNWPPYRDWKADVSSVSPSSEQICSDSLQIDLLWRRANARNVSFSISVRWSIYIINSVDKPNFCASLPHRRSPTVSLGTNPPLLIDYLYLSCG